ncbi:ketopantoate reductase family protein [Plantactinospora sp. KBS50]|uniref:ketopantoate reductase family protein n=1 Tax=Plantactinospora sp. KBS50 TaxID=2024580 RepID=UPI001E5E7F1B|nr:2-dehydropantoate 2-reductase N-terminal domain-containing protein [Plantactinospora sp. KBS50]
MRYLIIGAGAVGGTIGARLGRTGHEVTLVARGAHLAAIRERGLTLARPDGQETVRLPAYDDPRIGEPAGLVCEPDTVVVLAVKSQDTEAALRTWADVPVRGGGTLAERLPVLTAQNGVANERMALRYVQRVYPVCVWLPASFLEPGRIAAEGHPYPGMLQVGCYPAGGDDTVREIVADFTAAGFVGLARPDVLRWKYAKLLRNLANGLDALLGPDGAERSGLVARVGAEGAAVLDRAGIGYASPQEETAERGDRVNIRPVAGRARSGSSTWQSLARGTGSAETDHLNGEIALLGRLHGWPRR